MFDREDMLEHLAKTMKGVTSDRFERDTRAYLGKVASGKDRAAREQMREKYLNDMDLLEQEIDMYNRRLLDVIEYSDWTVDDVLNALKEISYEAREFLGRTIISKLLRSVLNIGGIAHPREASLLDQIIVRLLSKSSHVRYRQIARNPATGTMCPSNDFYDSSVSARSKPRRPPRHEAPRRQPEPEPSPPGDRSLTAASPSSFCTASIDSVDDLIGKNVRMFYPNYGYYWGTVVYPDPTDDSKVVIFHEEDNEYRSRKASEVRRRIRPP